MGIFGFLLGLTLGLLLWASQRSRSEAKVKHLLKDLKPDAVESPLSSTSQLSLAIARQQQVQRQLEQEIENFRLILNSAPLGWLQVDDEDRLLWCNHQARELLGITPEQCIKLPRLLLELVRSYELDQLIAQARSSHQPFQYDWSFYPVSPDPSKLFQKQPYALRAYAFPLLQNHVGIFIENRQEAINLMQQRDRWASDVAHELKTPLTSIRLVAETLQTRVDPALQGWVNRLINEAIRLSNLVQDLLDLSRIDRNSPNALQLKLTNLPDLIQAAWLSLDPLAKKKNLKLDYVGPDHLSLEVDESRLFRVLINLFDNSIKYSPPWQQIRAEINLDQSPSATPNEPQFICLEVIDAGPGFSEDALPYVFERFYRADPSRSQRLTLDNPYRVTSASSGESASQDNKSLTNYSQPSLDLQHRSSGLGLAIVKQIIEAHQGWVCASNHPETGGAWLRVYLPYSPSESATQNSNDTE